MNRRLALWSITVGLGGFLFGLDVAVISFQLNVVSGILIAYFSNYLLQGVGGANDWRWMLGVVALPSVVFSTLMLFTPETPRWLVLYKNDDEVAKRISCSTSGK